MSSQLFVLKRIFFSSRTLTGLAFAGIAALSTGCATMNSLNGNRDLLSSDGIVDPLELSKDEPVYRRLFPDLDVSELSDPEIPYPLLTDMKPHIAGELPGQAGLPLERFSEVASIAGPANLKFIHDDTPVDIWSRIRVGFTLPNGENQKKVQPDLQWFARHQSYLDRVGERAEKYIHLIVEEVEKRGLPMEIALLPVVESAYQPFAYSHGRAAGLWQFIPSTGRLYGLKQNWWYDGRRDVVASTDAALNYLTRLNQAYKGDWLLALAAYNSGQGTVDRAIRKNKRLGKPTDFWNLDLPTETQGYVPKLMAISALVDNPEKYGIELPKIPNEPFLAKVDTGSQIDLALAAELAEVSVEDLYRLNPGFNRWATDPKGPHTLLVPIENEQTFRENLAALPDKQRIRWERHTIKRGQNLLTIADDYHTTVELIKEVNNIRGNMIREGQNLVIPVAVKDRSQYVLSADQRLQSLQNTKRSGSSGQKVTYQVRKGDTLWDISRKYKVGVRTLAKWNGLAPRDTLRAGQNLVIWTKRGQFASSTQASFSPHSVTQKIGYRVRRGDSLALIASKFKVSIADLKKWNTLPQGNTLQPGQRLTLYVDVTQQAGV